MTRIFLDTNVFVRFLTQDEAGQSAQAEALLLRAQSGEVALVTGPPVLFELVWTLRRAYKVPRERCLDLLASLLAVQGLEILDHQLVHAAVERARASGAEFADAYVAASASAALTDQVATFDKADFARLGVSVYAWPG